jgi:hypothetical protein
MTLLAQCVALARDLIVIALGIYATVIVKKQLELKQTEIEAVKATTEHLKAMQAPSLAKDLKELSALADHLSATNRELQARIEKERGSATAVDIEKARVAGMAAGIVEGLGAVIEILRTFNVHESGNPLSPLAARPLRVVISEKRHQLQASLTQAVNGARPDFPNSMALRAIFANNQVEEGQ